MKCNNEASGLMHKYLDGDLNQQEEEQLRHHLENCETCQAHFHELKRTITLIQSAEHTPAPANFTSNVMRKLPIEKGHIKYRRWFKAHPILTAAAIFFVFMISGVFSAWNQDSQLVVSKQENLVIKGNTVIVPEGVTVDGDLLVKNGNLLVKGTIDGDVTMVNGKLVEEQHIEGEGLMASVGEVNGELEHVDQVFEWIWYNLKTLFKSIFAF